MAKNKSSKSALRSQQLIQQKRQAARILRQAGLYASKTKRQTDEQIRKSSYINKLRRDFADVISGATRAAKIPKIQLPVFKARGYRSHKGKVIVPREVKRATPRLAHEQPPPPPPTDRGGTPRRDGSFESCLRRVLAWFEANAHPMFGDSDERAEELKMYARQNPEVFRAIINESNRQGRQYLSGRPPLEPNWPDGVQAEIFLTLYQELYWYHPSEIDYTQSGGLMPRC